MGKMTYANGDIYDGKWNLDKWHGEGKYSWANGASYDGCWVLGQKHGTGVFTEAGIAKKGKWRFDVLIKWI